MLELALCWWLGAFEPGDRVLLGFLLIVNGMTALWVWWDLRSLRAAKRVRGLRAGVLGILVLLVWTPSFLCYLYVRAHLSRRPDRYSDPTTAGLGLALLTTPQAAHSRRIRVRRLIFGALGALLSVAAVIVAFGLSLKLVAWFDFPESLPAKDRAELLFGASSIALISISFVAALFAIVGWQALIFRIDERVQDQVAETAKRRASELDGRLLLLAGIIFYMLSLAKRSESEAPEEADKTGDPEAIAYRDLLDIGIAYTRRAIPPLEAAQAPQAWTAKNNLAYLLALRGDPADHDLARKLGLEVYGQHERESDHYLLLTYARVIITYPMSLEELDEVQRRLEKALRNVERTEEHSELIELYLDILKGKSAGPGSQALAQRLSEFRTESEDQESIDPGFRERVRRALSELLGLDD